MKKDEFLPKKKYGICPHCGLAIHRTIKIKNYSYRFEMKCTICKTVWEANFRYGYEDMIVSNSALTNKEKKQQKENLINKFDTLKKGIDECYKVDDLESRHNVLSKLDDEFKILCPKKYNAYFKLGDFNHANDPRSYKSYLDNRSFKMLKDINKILFYFGK